MQKQKLMVVALALAILTKPRITGGWPLARSANDAEPDSSESYAA